MDRYGDVTIHRVDI